MLENNNQNSEINLNLKVPPEQPDGSFSMKDLVLTLYNARKVFLLWCCIGLIAGIVGAGAYYMTTRNNTPVATAEEVSITLTLNYAGAEKSLFPNGAEFDIKSLYDTELWENVLKTVGKDDVTPADAINELKVAHYDPKAGLLEDMLKAVESKNITSANAIRQLEMLYNSELEIGRVALRGVENGSSTISGAISQIAQQMQQLEGTSDTTLSPNVLFELTIAADSEIFKNNEEKGTFLQVFCEEYKKSIEDKYFIEDNVGILYNQKMRQWDDICKEIIWDSFSFEKNFDKLSERYLNLADILEVLYADDPSYKSADTKSFNDYAKECRDICDNEFEQWKAKLKEDIYIRNIDRFKREYQFQIESMKINREYYMEMIASYNDLLVSFQQKEAQGARIQEAVNVLTAAQSHTETAADLQKQIIQMEYNLEMLQNNEQAIRSNSSEAETALSAFITDLGRNQEMLRGVIYDYYKQINERDAESSVIYTSANVKTTAQPASGISTTRLLMIFVGLTFVGFAVGFCAAFVKKYLPAKA